MVFRVFGSGAGAFLFVVCFSCAPHTACAQPTEDLKAATTNRQIDFIETEDVINNYGMGIYVSGWHHKRREDLPEFSNIVYERFSWKELEPTEGGYQFGKVQEFVRSWRGRGVRVGFRVMSSSIGKGTLTPEYVFEAGAPRVFHKPSWKKYYYTHETQWDPVYWHETYLEKYSRFVKALGAALDGGKGIEFVDLGGIGIWGEMHLAQFAPGMWTRDEMDRHGFSDDAYRMAYTRMISAYKEAFPNTRLFLNISTYSDIAEYAAGEGINLRYDGLTATGNYRESFIVRRDFRRLCGGAITISPKVACMYEFASSEQPLAQKLDDLKDAQHAPISYLHANLGKATTWPAELKAALKAMSKEVGFRLFPVSMSLPQSAKSGEKLIVRQQWRKTGVAPVRENFLLILKFLDSRGRPLSETMVSILPSSLTWNSDKTIHATSAVELPKEFAEQMGEIRFGLAGANAPREKFRLAIDGLNEDGLYHLSNFLIRDGRIYFTDSESSRDDRAYMSQNKRGTIH